MQMSSERVLNSLNKNSKEISSEHILNYSQTNSIHESHDKMMNNNGNLLLLEVYLHSIVLKKSLFGDDEKYDFIVKFKLLDSINFELLSTTVLSNRRTIKFKCGKSCLFYIPGDYPLKESGLNIVIEVWQRLSCACLPSKLLIGTGKISILNRFIKKIDEEIESIKPKAVVEHYSCFDTNNEEVLVMNIFTDTTNLGNTLISQYKFLPENNSNIQVIADDGPQYEVKRVENEESQSSQQKTPFEYDENLPDVKKQMSIVKCANETSPRMSGILDRSYDEFEEIGTVFNGNEIKIRIPKRKIKQSSHVYLNNIGNVNCPEDILNSKSTQNQIFMNITDDFSKLRNDFRPYCTNVAYSNEQDQILTISPRRTPPGVEALKIVDPNKDVFLLRIKKTSKLLADNRATLELEFITPKGPTKTATPRLETRDTQYDENDIISTEKTNASYSEAFDKLSEENVSTKPKQKQKLKQKFKQKPKPSMQKPKQKKKRGH